MHSDHTRTSPPRLLILVLAAGFALSHTQAPLFFSNQNQYLLHGFARAGSGNLSHDWLANTRDPTPAFSVLVAGLYALGGGFAIQAAFFLVLMVYFIAMWRLVEVHDAVRIVPFAALFTAAHAAIFRLASVRLVGADYPWFFQCGLANQYLLGPGLQPSAFGVLLVVSAAAFARGKPHRAAVAAAAAADIHATYLLPAAFLTLGYAAALLRDKRFRTALSVSGLSLAGVAPMLLYLLLAFPPTHSEQFAEAQHILATVRIPHHAQVSRWFDWTAALQLVWIALGWRAMGLSLRIPGRGSVWELAARAFLPAQKACTGRNACATELIPSQIPNRWPENQGAQAPRSPGLRFALTIAALLAVILSAVQFATRNDTLALLFPWRISALLVPLATAIIAAKLAAHPRYPAIGGILAAMIFALEAGGGAFIMARGLGYPMNADELPMMRFIRDHGGPEDVYLIPTRVPKSSGKRGVPSTSFTAPPRPQPGSQLIPVDLQRFRLLTGEPIFVDFKSVPYAAEEVLEWQRRIERVQAWYQDPDWNRPGLREELRQEGITHVVATRQHPLNASFLATEYQDRWYIVYRVKP